MTEPKGSGKKALGQRSEGVYLLYFRALDELVAFIDQNVYEPTFTKVGFTENS